MAIKINKTAPKSKRRLKFKDLQTGDIFTVEGSNYWWIKMDNQTMVSLHGEMEYLADEANVSRLKTDLVFNVSDDDLQEWI